MNPAPFEFNFQSHIEVSDWFFIILISIIAISLALTITLPEKAFPWTLIYTVPIALGVWLTVTMLTKPVDENILLAFYQRVHPGGTGWKRISDKLAIDYRSRSLFKKQNFVAALCGIIAVYSMLFGFGNIFIGNKWIGMLLFIVMFVCIYIVLKNLSGEKWEATA
jgi:hypothetical protein